MEVLAAAFRGFDRMRDPQEPHRGSTFDKAHATKSTDR